MFSRPKHPVVVASERSLAPAWSRDRLERPGVRPASVGPRSSPRRRVAGRLLMNYVSAVSHIAVGDSVGVRVRPGPTPRLLGGGGGGPRESVGPSRSLQGVRVTPSTRSFTRGGDILPRRGAPTISRAFGPDVVLAGALCLTLSWFRRVEPHRSGSSPTPSIRSSGHGFFALRYGDTTGMLVEPWLGCCMTFTLRPVLGFGVAKLCGVLRGFVGSRLFLTVLGRLLFLLVARLDACCSASGVVFDLRRLTHFDRAPARPRGPHGDPRGAVFALVDRKILAGKHR